MRRKVFPGTEISVTEIIFVADEHNFPAYNLQNVRHGKLYHIAFLHLNRTKLFDLSLCFLGDCDNFWPHVQAELQPVALKLLQSIVFYSN